MFLRFDLKGEASARNEEIRRSVYARHQALLT